MHSEELILTLTGGLSAALLLGYVTHRLGLSPIVGYLLAGFVVESHIPGFNFNEELADQFAEIGIILLMFGVGLQFRIEELLKGWQTVVPGSVIHSLASAVLGCLAVVAIGWSWPAGLIFGLAISVSSTVVALRVFTDNKHLHTPAGRVAISWLVVEDLFTVLVLVLLPALFHSGRTGAANVALTLGWSILKLVLLLAFTVFVGRRLIPWFLDHMATTRSRELFTLAVLATALGIAVGSARLFGVSMALGAFLAGMIVGQSEFSLRAATEALPMRDAFAVLFFVSVGMLFAPARLLEAPGLTTATLAIVLLGKPIAALLIARQLGYPPRIMLALAVAAAQIGEFSFILAALGKELGVLPDGVINALVAAAIASICLNPLLYRLIDPLEKWAQCHPRLWRWLKSRMRARAEAGQIVSSEEDHASASRHEAIVVGYGPVGRTLVRLLRENHIEPTAIELNVDVVRRLHAEGTRAIYGDAMHRDTLRAAGIERAEAIFLTSAGMHGTGEIVRLAREANPKVRVLARTIYLHEIEALRHAGADAIFSGEGELALTMTEFVLRRLGATQEQIDRQRDRVRVELFGAAPSAKSSILGKVRPSAVLASEAKSA